MIKLELLTQPEIEACPLYEDQHNNSSLISSTEANIVNRYSYVCSSFKKTEPRKLIALINLYTKAMELDVSSLFPKLIHETISKVDEVYGINKDFFVERDHHIYLQMPSIEKQKIEFNIKNIRKGKPATVLQYNE